MVGYNSKITQKGLKLATYLGLLIFLVLLGIDDLYAQDRITGFTSHTNNTSRLINQSVENKGIKISKGTKDTTNYFPKLNASAGIFIGGGFLGGTMGNTFFGQYIFKNRMSITAQYINTQLNLITDNYGKGKSLALFFGYHFGKKIIQASTSAGISYNDFKHYGLGFSRRKHKSIGLALNAKVALTYEWIGIGLQGVGNISKKNFSNIVLFVEIGKLW